MTEEELTAVDGRLLLSASCLATLRQLKTAHEGQPDNRKTEQAYLSETVRALSRLGNNCFWCKYGEFAGDLLKLFTLATPNPYTEWFERACTYCLASCRECIEAYYGVRPRVYARVGPSPGHPLVVAFSQALHRFDCRRLAGPLHGFLDGQMDQKRPELIFALFEVLIFPAWMDDPTIGGLLVQVLDRLISTKKMLKVTELLPGLVVGAFSEHRQLCEWSCARLAAGLTLSRPFIADALDFDRLACRALSSPEPEARKSLLLVLSLLPEELIPTGGSWVGRLFEAFEGPGVSDRLVVLRCIFTLMSRFAHREGFLAGVFDPDRLARCILGRPSPGSQHGAQRSFLLSRDDVAGPWAGSTDDDLELLAIVFLVDWLAGRGGRSDDQLCSLLGSWMAGQRDIHGLGLLLGVLYREATVQRLLGSMHFTLGFLVRHLRSCQVVVSRDGTATHKSAIVSLCVKNAVRVCVRGVQLGEIKAANVAHVLHYCKELVGIGCLTEDDLGSLMRHFGSDLAEQPRLLNTAELVGLVARAFLAGQQGPRLSDHGQCLVVILAAPDLLTVPMVAERLDLFSRCISPSFKEPGLLARFVLSLMPRAIARTQSHDASWRCIQFSPHFQTLPLQPSDLPCLLDLMGTAVEFADPDWLLPALQLRYDSLLQQYLKLHLVLGRQHAALATSAAFSRLIVKIVRRLADRRVVIDSGLFSGLSHPSHVRDAIRAVDPYYRERTGHGLLPHHTQPVPKASPCSVAGDGQRLIESLSSRNVPILPAPDRPMSKLGMIRSELEREAGTHAPPPKAQRLAKGSSLAMNQAARLATLPDLPRRLAHVPRDSKGSVAGSDSDEPEQGESLTDVCVALKKESSKVSEQTQRSIKVIEVDGGDGLSSIDPATAKLLPKKTAAFPPARSQSFWHRLQRHILALDMSMPSRPRPAANPPSAIPTVFKSAREYESVFEPLLFLETEAQILQAREELDGAADPQAGFELVIAGVAMVDEFHEVSGRTDREEPGSQLADLDVVTVHFALPTTTVPMLGIVFKSSVRRGISEIGIRLWFGPMRLGLQLELREGVRLKVGPLCHLVTSSREHQAMCHLESFGAITGRILAPRYEEGLARRTEWDRLAPSLMESFRLNRSQAHAVASSLVDGNPFTLVQGPPGTGKTCMILALLSTIFETGRPGLGSLPRYPRALVCAPSNAAIDEIARRLMGTFADDSGGSPVVRIGSPDMIDEAVKPVSLDVLVERLVQGQGRSADEELSRQRQAVRDLSSQLSLAERVREAGDVSTVRSALWQAREAVRKTSRAVEETRLLARNTVLTGAKIVCCTLSGAGHESLGRLFGSGALSFELVVIDEACQAVELSTLIPLQWGCRKCILVGDPNQLPPTVISQAAIAQSYEQSLFKRMQRACGEQVLLLSVQYRMHPEIAAYPSAYYYQGRLLNGPTMDADNVRPWHSIDILGPYRFFDVPGVEERQRLPGGRASKSQTNSVEAEMISFLVAYLCAKFPTVNFFQRIGIITPYRDQRRRIRGELVRRFGNDTESLWRAIDVSTVDGFQGQEREIIIFSYEGIGFLNDARRMNVALTRAKCSLFVFGRAETLRGNSKLWGSLIDDARSRGVLIPHDREAWKAIRREVEFSDPNSQTPKIPKIPKNLLK